MEFMNNFIEVGWTIMKFGLVLTGSMLTFIVLLIVIRAFIDAIFNRKGTKFNQKSKRNLTVVRKEDDQE